MISVIIPAYNHLPDALRCLNSLQVLSASSHQYLLQDDASPDINYMNGVIHPAQAVVERNPSNLGFAGNCNAGAKRAGCDVLFFVNQDVYADARWSGRWDEYLEAAFTDDSVGIVGARLLFPDGSLQSAGGLLDAKCQPYHRCLSYRNPLAEEVNIRREITWVTGAALAIRRRVFEQLGGFDTVYRAYFEDVDLCLRAWDCGFRVVYDPTVTLMHSVGSTGGSAHFSASARTFRKRWVDSGKIEPDTNLVAVGYW